MAIVLFISFYFSFNVCEFSSPPFILHIDNLFLLLFFIHLDRGLSVESVFSKNKLLASLILLIFLAVLFFSLSLISAIIFIILFLCQFAIYFFYFIKLKIQITNFPLSPVLLYPIYFYIFYNVFIQFKMSFNFFLSQCIIQKCVA